jgi:hypothetical protein
MSEEQTPAWLTAKVDQRVALILEVMGAAVKGIDDYTTVMTPLTEPAEGASPAEIQRWERMCDNCGRYCGVGEDFFTGHLVRDVEGHQVVFMFGSCPRCVEKEES